MRISRFRSAGCEGTLFQTEGLEFLKGLDTESASLVFLDPPFNLGKSYSGRTTLSDRKPEREYRDWISSVLRESVRVLKPGGTLYLYHLPIWAMRLGAVLEFSLDFRHWIAISMKNGFVRGRRLYPAHYSLLMFSKGPPGVFRVPKWPLSECRHCGEFLKDYGGYLPLVEVGGVNLSDFWEDLSPVRHRSRKNRKANELPAVLFRRVFEISGHEGGLYVDPFAGSGTGVLTAVRLGMKFAACDLLKGNFDLICRRVKALRSSLRGAQ